MRVRRLTGARLRCWANRGTPFPDSHQEPAVLFGYAEWGAHRYQPVMTDLGGSAAQCRRCANTSRPRAMTHCERLQRLEREPRSRYRGWGSLCPVAPISCPGSPPFVCRVAVFLLAMFVCGSERFPWQRVAAPNQGLWGATTTAGSVDRERVAARVNSQVTKGGCNTAGLEVPAIPCRVA